MSADGFWLTDVGWDETGPRTRARARPLARGGGVRARISGLSTDAAAWAWGRGVVVGGCFAVIFGSGGDGGVEAMVRQMNFVYDICYE